MEGFPPSATDSGLMITSIMLWNEPNNLSHWDFQMDPEWRQFSTMIRGAARVIKELAPDLPLVLGGISPIDPNFIKLLTSYGVLEHLDAVGVHGFPLDWNHWQIDDWPRKIKEIEDVCPLPVWVTEVGASSFGADEVQVFGIRADQRAAPRPGRAHLLVLAAGSAPDVGGHDASQGERRQRLLPAFLSGPGRRRRAGQAGPRAFRQPHGHLPVVSFRGPPAGLRGRFAQVARGPGAAHRRKLGGLAPAERRRLVRPPDAQARGLRRDADVLLHAAVAGPRSCHTSPPVDPAEFSRFAAEVVQTICARRWRIRIEAAATNPTSEMSSPRTSSRSHNPKSREGNRHEQDQDRDRRTRQLCEQPAPRH